MLGIGGTLKEKPDDTELQRVMVGDVELKEMRRERGHFTGYKEKGAETVVVNMRMAKKGYTLEVHFLGGGEWIQNLKGDELKKTLEERGFKGDELGKVLHEGNLRGAALDKTLKGADTIRVVEGKEGGGGYPSFKMGQDSSDVKRGDGEKPRTY